MAPDTKRRKLGKGNEVNSGEEVDSLERESVEESGASSELELEESEVDDDEVDLEDESEAGESEEDGEEADDEEEIIDKKKNSFSKAMTSILASKIKAHSRNDPILVRNKQPAKRLEESKLEAKAKRLIRLEKKQKQDNGRVKKSTRAQRWISSKSS